MVLSRLVATLAALSSACFGSIAAAADPVADFYSGKTITLIISTGPGGGVDLNARILARRLGAHIPGHPTIIAQNMTGAGHLQATNYLFNAAPRDGTAIAAILPAFVGYQVLDGRGAQYDARKFNWLGSSDVDNANLYTWRTTGVASIEDAKRKEVLMGATGAGSYTVLYPTLLNNVLGTKFKIVSGYKSASEIHLAMERGEVEGRAGNFFTSLRASNPTWITEKKINMLLQIGAERDPAWPDTPLLNDLARTEDERRLFQVFSAEIALGRPFLTTPVIPADRLAALRAAFQATVADPAFIDEARKAEMEVRPLDADKAKALADGIINMPAETIARAKAAIELKTDSR